MTGKSWCAPAHVMPPGSIRATTTQETPFCLADASGYSLFAVRDGVRADTALAQAASMLRTAHGLLVNSSEMGDDDQYAAGLFLLEGASALIDSINGGQP
ncbi:MAG: DUF3077 domain-containing protein [Castellaniella sp.]